MTYKFFHQILDTIIWLSIIPAVIGAFQRHYTLHYLRPNNIWQPFDGRVYSIFSNPNFYAFIVAFVIVIIIYRIITSPSEKYSNIFYYSVLLLNIVALTLTNSRSSIIALLAGIIIIAISHKNFVWPSILIAIYVVYFFALEAYPDIFPRMDLIYLDRGLYERIEIWEYAWEGIRRQPFIGYGALGYHYLGANLGALPKNHAHNLLIDTVVSYGVIGTALIMVYFGKYFIKSRTLLKNHAGRSVFTLIVSLVMITLIHGITDMPLLGISTGALFFILLAGFGIKKEDLADNSVMMTPKKSKKQQEIANIWSGKDREIPSDVLGSYTGNPPDENNPELNDKPTQDGDDI